MTKAKKARKLGPKRVLKTAEHLLIRYLQNSPELLNGRRQICDAIEVLSVLSGNVQPYDWKGSESEATP